MARSRMLGSMADNRSTRSRIHAGPLVWDFPQAGLCSASELDALIEWSRFDTPANSQPGSQPSTSAIRVNELAVGGFTPRSHAVMLETEQPERVARSSCVIPRLFLRARNLSENVATNSFLHFFCKCRLTDSHISANTLCRFMHHPTEKASTRYKTLRAKLIARGFTLRSFAQHHGYAYPTVYCAARGSRNGVKSVSILTHLEEVANA